MQLKVLVLAALLVPALAFGQNKPGEFRLGVVDFQKALNSVEEGKSAKEKLKKEFEEKQKEIEGRKTKLDKLQGEIQELQKQAQSGIVKPEVMEKGRKLEGDFQKQFEEYTKVVQQHQRDITDKEQKATSDILAKLRDLVVELGRTGGFTMVLEANESGLLYASAPTDLTEQLIQKYNGAHKAAKK